GPADLRPLLGFGSSIPFATFTRLCSWTLLFWYHVISSVTFVQTHKPSGQYLHKFDEHEQFHVDFDQKETVWWLLKFGHIFSFDAQIGLGDIAVDPMELEEHNILICHIDKFSPPVINVTWLCHGEPVTTGVSETTFMPRDDYSFHKFHYLTFLPPTDDVYDCVVEHWGLEKPLFKHWEPEMLTPPSEPMETLLYIIGLAGGLVGITVAATLIMRSLHLGKSHLTPQIKSFPVLLNLTAFP
uniref:Ig-like domain-containing protein n=1 Tax=Vombatus ursinus TaxID=29139 RepID=A0A4X2KDZ3_VOMUR